MAARKQAPAPVQVGFATIQHAGEAQQYLNRGDSCVVAWRPIFCSGFDVDEQGKRHYHHIEGLACTCPPGPHVYSFWAQADEVALLGGRGSGKSEDTIGILMRGNKHKTGHPCDITYLNHPEYRFLVLRSTSEDLEEYFTRMRNICEPMGAKFTENPRRAKFPSGAEGLFFHMGDDTWKKSQGRGFVRIVMEEASHVNEDVLLSLIESNRTKHNRHMLCQIILTANPNGPGLPWLNARYRYPGGRTEVWPSGKIYNCPVTGRSRMYFHTTADDNPYFLDGRQAYIKALDSHRQTSESKYQRMRLGNFDAIEGAYFQSFRRKPMENEPANACHVVKANSVELAPWWPRAIACDWGFSHKAAAGWFCWTPQRQLHVYREIVVSGVGTVELGARIADASIPELSKMEKPTLTLHLSPDAFSRTDYTLTEAELMAQGIDRVFGHGMALVAAPSIEEELLQEDEARMAVEQRIAGSKAAIVIARANNARRAGWQQIREYLRWWKLAGEPTQEELQRLLRTKGELELREYLRRLEQSQNEVLPVLQIWDCCSNLIRGIERAQESDTDSEDVKKSDDDEIDMLRYGCAGFRPYANALPKDVWIQQQVSRVLSAAPAFGRNFNSLVMATAIAEQKWEKQGTGRAVNVRRPFGHRPM